MCARNSAPSFRVSCSYAAAFSAAAVALEETAANSAAAVGSSVPPDLDVELLLVMVEAYRDERSVINQKKKKKSTIFHRDNGSRPKYPNVPHTFFLSLCFTMSSNEEKPAPSSPVPTTTAASSLTVETGTGSSSGSSPASPAFGLFYLRNSFHCVCCVFIGATLLFGYMFEGRWCFGVDFVSTFLSFSFATVSHFFSTSSLSIILFLTKI